MLQAKLEGLVDSPRFSMTALQKEVWPLVEDHFTLSGNLSSLQRELGRANYAKLNSAILRHVFLIELVKLPKVESTKFRVRWCDQLEHDAIDAQEKRQRYCSFDECLEIAVTILDQLTGGWLDTPDNKETLQLFFNHRLLPYEAPIDYIQSVARSDERTRIHRLDNIQLLATPTVLQTLRLRKLLTDIQTSPDATFFQKVLKKKIKTKTYLTDRVLTGDHKTNREKRWEAHPHSEHFATRRDCLEIEYRLITQLIGFLNFPAFARESLQSQNVVLPSDEAAKCPITLEQLDFAAFRDALVHARHGRSDFQVGHLNPLKLGEAGSATGHTAANVSWVSADGNRIQGSYSLTRTRAMIHQIEKRYETAGIVPEIEASIAQQAAEFAQEEAVIDAEETARAKADAVKESSEANDEDSEE